ncbi:lysosomal alpha-glucosidase-like isoform X2 [Mercenaria mercenaria]|uniref:lysosomal alpha-glucosidase-like isoform X2 n=1 Tax=Mercenaria mercenaria TaxID=6596 RepID=UPI00234F14DF|nr:lysosomal alpha-glucosidase-like isoform X2 [Mercenaria mercenaria]
MTNLSHVSRKNIRSSDNTAAFIETEVDRNMEVCNKTGEADTSNEVGNKTEGADRSMEVCNKTEGADRSMEVCNKTGEADRNMGLCLKTGTDRNIAVSNKSELNFDIKKFTLVAIAIFIIFLGLDSLFGMSMDVLWMTKSGPFGDSENNDFKTSLSDKQRSNSWKHAPEKTASYLYLDYSFERFETVNLDSISEDDMIGPPLDIPSSKKQCDITNPSEKFDCFPEKSISEEGCMRRGCCWQKDATRRKPLKSRNENDTQAPVDVPYCFYPRNFPGYSVDERKDTPLGFSMNLSGQPPTYYPRGVRQLAVEVYYETNQRLHVKVYDPNIKRYEVPMSVPKADQRAANPAYTVTVSETGTPFWLSVTRKCDNSVLFSTKGAAPLIFTDQFLQLSSLLPSPYIYGIGEHRNNLMLNMNWTRKTLWNRDHYPLEGTNMYGSHPFYLVMEESGKANGFFLLNSNGMDVVLQPYPAVTWRTIGGILDFYIFVGQKPADIVREYTNVVGRTFMPPYWSLGFHICKFGYKSVNDTMMVVNRVRKAEIPHDTQWNDIDYAVGRLDFTTDVERFGDQAAMVDELHRRGMKYIIIVDPGISNSQPLGSYSPYDLGVEMDIFIKNESNKLFVGRLWPGTTVFPDWSNGKSHTYWAKLIGEFWKHVAVDGLWIDMDELGTFADGSVTGCDKNSEYNSPPYLPDVAGGTLYSRTICPSARQKLSTYYNLHNMYGMMETNATYHALKSLPLRRRPFVISRSTFSGQGHYGGHWTGDNIATFYDLYKSISVILTFNMAGIPMVGADICGFQHDTTYELCLRWYQLGAFYPFSRTHSDKPTRYQDPGAFDDFFAASVRDVYQTRYSLLPYLYTLFYESYTTGTPVARAMFYEFPNNKDTYHIDNQFMWGSGLLIAPVLTEKSRSVDVYLPLNSVWYNFYSGQRLTGKGKNMTLPAPLNIINLLVQAGSIIPMQEYALTTTESRLKDFSLLIAMGTNGTASGSLYWDDGITQESLEMGSYNFVEFTLTENKVRSKVQVARYEDWMLMKNVTIYGVDLCPVNVTMNGAAQAFAYDSSYKVLKMPTLKPRISLLKDFLLTWEYSP